MIIFFFLLFFSISLQPSHIFAQVHPGLENFNFSLKNEAEVLFARGQYKESIEKYKEVLKSEGETSYIFRTMLKAWKAMDDLNSAEKFLNNYQTSTSTHVWYAFGYLNYLREDYPNAEKSFEQAIKMDSKNGLAWNNWGAILSEKKEYALAVKRVQRAIDVNPRETIFVRNLNAIYKKMGDLDRFENEYKKLLERKSKKRALTYGKVLARVIRQKAFGFYSKGELDNTILGFQEMLKIYQEIDDIKGQVPVFFSLGLLHEEKGNIKKSQEYFTRVLSINPNHIQAKDKIKTSN